MGNDVQQTAYQLALADYSQIGKGGWLADAISGSVIISPRDLTQHPQAPTQLLGRLLLNIYKRKGGEDQTNTFITSGSFNIDKLDGSGPSGMVLDPQKGNAYQIGYQYLGFGNPFCC